MDTTASFIGSNPIFDCALAHKFEYFWSVNVPIESSNFKLESPIVRVIKSTFSVSWQFVYLIGQSGTSFAAKLLNINNNDVEVFVNCYIVNYLKNDYKICVLNVKFSEQQSHIKYWEKEVNDSSICDVNDTNLKFHILKWQQCAFKEIPLKIQIEFRVIEMKAHIKPILELSRNLREFRERDEDLCDVTFVVNEKEFKAHKSILMARSPVFTKMLNSDMQESRNNKICVSHVEPEVFEQFLNFVYSGKMDCEANCDIWSELLFVAEQYDIQDLKTLCMDMMTSLFSIEEMPNVFAIANLMNDKIFRRAAVDFVAGQSKSVKKSKAYRTLIKSHPFLLNEMKKY